MYLSYLKWSVYVRIKRNLINIKLFKKLSPSLLLIGYGVLQITKFISTIIITNVILESYYILVNNIYLDSMLIRMQDKKIVLLVFFVLYVVLEVHNHSIKTVKMKEGNSFKRWLLANTAAEEKKLDLIILLEYIIFNGFNIITFQVPVIGVVLLKNKFSILTTFIMVSLYIVIILLTTLLLALLYSNYLEWIKNTRKIGITIIKNIVERVTVITIFYFWGVSLSKWMNDFPLVQRIVDIKVFEQWINRFQISFINNIEAYIINIFKYIEKTRPVLIVLAMITILIIQICIILILLKSSNKEKVSNKNEKYKNSRKYYGKNLNTFRYYFKIMLDSRYVIRNLSSICGSIFYWAIMGFYMGLLKYIDVNSKVYYFIIISYIFYPSFLLTEGIYEKMMGKYSIDGEGKKIYFWINKNIFKLFKYKRIILLINIMAISIVSNIVIGMSNRLPIILIIKLVVIQVIFAYTIFNILSIPSIIFPYFQYSNIEELNDYVDKKEFKNTITFSTFIVGIPILVLPTALYLTDYIRSTSIYSLMQFYIVSLILVVINRLINRFIIKKVNDPKYFYKIFDS